MINKAPDKQLEKKLNWIAWAVTAVVIVLVSTMHRFKIESSIDFTFLPATYSALNAITAVILLFGLYYIKKRSQRNTKRP